MSPELLREEISIELESIETIVRELQSLNSDVGTRQATVRERTAAAFLAQFYNGIENILKRICRYHNVSLPTGETWPASFIH